MNNMPVVIPKSAMATTKRPGLTDRYNFFNTSEFIDIFDEQGFIPTKATEVRPRKMDRIGFQRHMIRFRMQDDMGILDVGTIFPEIVLTNSHDGTSSFCLRLGLFRIVCTNQSVIGQGMFKQIRMIHAHKTLELVKEGILSLTSKLPFVRSQIENFNSIHLTKGEQVEYAIRSLRVKYNQPEMREQYAKAWFDLNALLKPRRIGDEAPTLWNTYNIIQEKFTNGSNGDAYVVTTHGGRKSSHGIKSIAQSITMNEALWEETAKFAEERR